MLPYAGPALYVSGCQPEVVPNIVESDLCATTSNPDEKNENDRQTDRQLSQLVHMALEQYRDLP
jgi:hypothetical protein